MSLVSLAEYDRAKQDLANFKSKEAAITKKREELLSQKPLAIANKDTAALARIDAEYRATGPQLFQAIDGIIKNQELISVYENQTVRPSLSDTTRAEKYQRSAEFNTETAELPGEVDFNPGSVKQTKSLDSTKRVVPGVAPGAQPRKEEPTSFNFIGISGKKLGQDLRVRIRVPSGYLTDITKGLTDELTNNGGVLFPYTPSISFDTTANYTSMNPMHSNFPINFYQRSSIGEISITGKFTVENSREAAVWIATVHLLRALTRMRSGGLTGDPDSGSPPPVCRLDAYGDMMLKNVPVAIKSIRVDLPEGIDYFTFKGAAGYGPTSVPIISTITVSCLPMYSRNEMQGFSVSKYLGSVDVKKQGFI